MSDATDIQVAIATAFLDVQDSTLPVKVVLTEDQVVRILKAITRVPEGIAAEPNKELLQLLRPVLATRPWLAGRVGKVLQQNATIYNSVVASGRTQRLAMAAGIKRN